MSKECSSSSPPSPPLRSRSKTKINSEAPESDKSKLRRATSPLNVNGKTAQETVEFSARLTARIRHAEYKRLHCECGECVQPCPYYADQLPCDDTETPSSRSEQLDKHNIKCLNDDFIPYPTALSRYPQTLDTLSVLFGSLRAVSSKYDHTNFQYRTMASQFHREEQKDISLQLHAYERERSISIVQRALRPYIPVRTRIMDDIITQWCSEKRDNKSQIVFLGGGFDTRAFRLPCVSHVDIFEVDQKDVIEFKNSLLPSQNDRKGEHPVSTTKLPVCTCSTCQQCCSSTVLCKENLAQTNHPTQKSHSLHRCIGDLGTRVAMHDKKVQLVYKQHNNIAQLVVKYGLFESNLLPNVEITSTEYHTILVQHQDDVLATLDSNTSQRIFWIVTLQYNQWKPWVPTLWLAEGVLMYLTRNQVEEILVMTSGFPNHKFVFDMYSTCTSKSGSSYYSLFKSGMNREEIPMLMKTCGFDNAKIGIFGKSGYGLLTDVSCDHANQRHTYKQQNTIVDGITYHIEENKTTDNLALMVPSTTLIHEQVPISMLPAVIEQTHTSIVPDLPACINSPLCLCYYPDAKRFLQSDMFPLTSYPHNWANDLTLQYIKQTTDVQASDPTTYKDNNNITSQTISMQNTPANDKDTDSNISNRNNNHKKNNQTRSWTLQSYGLQKTIKDRLNHQVQSDSKNTPIPPLYPLHYDRFSPNDGKNEGAIYFIHQPKCPKQSKDARKTTFNYTHAKAIYNQDPQNTQLDTLQTIQNLKSIKQFETETSCTCDPKLANVECYLIIVDTNKL